MLDIVKTGVQDFPHKLFIGGLPYNWSEDHLSITPLCEVILADQSKYWLFSGAVLSDALTVNLLVSAPTHDTQNDAFTANYLKCQNAQDLSGTGCSAIWA